MNKFTNKVIVDLDILSTSMEDGVTSNLQCREIITEKRGRMVKKDIKLAKQKREPTNLSDDGDESTVFYLAAKMGNSDLFLGRPRHKIRANKDE